MSGSGDLAGGSEIDPRSLISKPNELERSLLYKTRNGLPGGKEVLFMISMAINDLQWKSGQTRIM